MYSVPAIKKRNREEEQRIARDYVKNTAGVIPDGVTVDVDDEGFVSVSFTRLKHIDAARLLLSFKILRFDR